MKVKEKLLFKKINDVEIDVTHICFMKQAASLLFRHMPGLWTICVHTDFLAASLQIFQHWGGNKTYVKDNIVDNKHLFHLVQWIPGHHSM